MLDQAEQHLLVEAKTHDAAALRRLGKHLLDVIDPDGADERLEAQLAAEEAKAAQECELTMGYDGQGSCVGRFRVPTLRGEILETLLDAVMNPVSSSAVAGTGDPLASTEASSEGPWQRSARRGKAFCDLLERFPTDRVPRTAGGPVSVVVTIPLEVLEGRLGVASLLGTDHRLSAGAARRLACEHGLIPAVLGGPSVVLDWGRTRRFHSLHQRTAMTVQQGGTCAIHGCDRPIAWCEAHHAERWVDGGPTNLANGVMICSRHHSLAHDKRLDLRQHADGTWRYDART